MIEPTEELVPIIKSAVDELNSKIERVKSFTRHVIVAMQFVADPPLAEFCAAHKVYVGLCYEFFSVQGVTVHVDNLERVAHIVPALRWFAQHDYKLQGKPQDYPEIRRRSWDLGPIKILGFFRQGEGPGCRYIEVGQVTKPIYKLMCDDAEVP